MKRVAVLGANGQVGAEVCLLLARRPGIEIIPVCRNRLGSAFLRFKGIRCRHGSVEDPVAAAAMLADCDAVLNFALSQRRPRDDRRANRAVIENAAAFSRPGAPAIFFSTMSVYGDPSPRIAGRPRSAYGREKLRSEADARRAGRRHGKPTWSLRLGHVCGELQGITAEIRRLVTAGPVAMPEGGAPTSNTVYTATIVDAVLGILDGRHRPGTYDLMNAPPWTWRDVFAYEAAKAGVRLEVRPIPLGRKPGQLTAIARRVRGAAAAAGSAMVGASTVRERGMALLAVLPPAWSARVQARHFTRRAMREIAGLAAAASSLDALDWEPLGRAFLAPLRPTAELLADPGLQLDPAGAGSPFPDDLPSATR